MTTITSANVRSALRGLWWLVLVRGILLIALGVLALVLPGATVTALVLLLGIYAVVDGIVLIVNAVVARAELPAWGWLVAQGVLAVVAGLIVLTLPGLTGAVAVLAILWFIVIATIVGGLFELVAAVRHRGGGWAIASGILDVLLGIVLLIVVVASPAAAALTLVWILGVYAIVFGIVLILVAFQVRRGGPALERVAEAIEDRDAV